MNISVASVRVLLLPNYKKSMKTASQKIRKALSTERNVTVENVGKRTDRRSRALNTTRKNTMTPKYMS